MSVFIGSISYIGQSVIRFFEKLGRNVLFLLDVSLKLFAWPIRWKTILSQVYFIGVRSFVFVTLSSFLIGLILSNQLIFELSSLGSADNTGIVIFRSLLREISPVIGAFLVIAKAGSAICSELASMRHGGQLDALECMAIDPVKFLIVPRFWAMLISMPLLVSASVVFGFFGGYIGSVVFGDVAQGVYVQAALQSLSSMDLTMGLVKSLIFAVVIIWIATSKGYLVNFEERKQYRKSVGLVTTDAAVWSVVWILFVDYVLSVLLMH